MNAKKQIILSNLQNAMYAALLEQGIYFRDVHDALGNAQAAIEQLHDQPIDVLALPISLSTLLKQNHIEKVGELLHMSIRNIMKMEGFGEARASQLLMYLAAQGFYLK